MKGDLKCGVVYFEPVGTIFQALTYLKSHNKFYVTKSLSSEDMFRFSDVNIDIQGENESVVGKNINDGEGITRKMKQYGSVEDALDMHRTASNTAQKKKKENEVFH